MAQRFGEKFFGSPQVVSYTLIFLNVAVYLFCLLNSSGLSPNARTLVEYGALVTGTLERGEYWRLFAYAFLHANALHILFNMICIAAWSTILEERIGSAYLIIVYIAATLGGALASLYGHPGLYLGVGASGAISGVVGALLALTILGKLPLTAEFFVVTIGVNALFASLSPSIDWQSHLGGFTGGFIACALLNEMAKLSQMFLSCRFPEFVKFGLVCVAASGALFIMGSFSGSSQAPFAALLGLGLALIVAVKAIDVLLAQKKGLAVAALFTAVACGTVPLAVSTALAETDFPSCLEATATVLKILPGIDRLAFLNTVCGNGLLIPAILSVLAFLVALLALRPEIARGLADVGFVSATLRAERNRRSGL